MHICFGNVTTIGSDNGLSPGWHQTIIWTNCGILLIGTLGTNFSEILIEIQTFSFKKMRLKVSSAKWWPFCLCLNVLMALQAWQLMLLPSIAMSVCHMEYRGRSQCLLLEPCVGLGKRAGAMCDAWWDFLVRALITRFMGPTCGPSGAGRTQMDPMLAPWTLLSGSVYPALKWKCFVHEKFSSLSAPEVQCN